MMHKNFKELTWKIAFVLIFTITNISFLHSQNTSKLDSIIELGDDMINLDDYDAAEDRYDEALDMNDDYPPAIEAKIKVLTLKKKFSKASKIARNAIEGHPDYTPFYVYLGQIQIERERFEEALKNLNKAISMVDEDADRKLMSKIYVNRGAALQKTGDFDDALESYSKALQINQHNPNVFVYRGYLYYKRDNYDQAISDFKQVLDLDPNNHYAQYNIGMAHFKKGNKLEACDAFHKACELGNKNACKMVISKCLRGGNN
jgi:tetratricopeptide (TPR) repeat protein